MVKPKKQKTSEQEMSTDGGSAGEKEPTEILEVETSDALQGIQDKANEYLGGWQRALAEFANYKKRIEREQAQTYQNAVGSVVKRYLPIVDDLERALANPPVNAEATAWVAGIELIYRKMVAALEADGVKTMEAEGQPFDPTLHEAIATVPTDNCESGQIIEVLQKGYLIGDRVVRHALVRVAE